MIAMIKKICAAAPVLLLLLSIVILPGKSLAASPHSDGPITITTLSSYPDDSPLVVKYSRAGEALIGYLKKIAKTDPAELDSVSNMIEEFSMSLNQGTSTNVYAIKILKSKLPYDASSAYGSLYLFNEKTGEVTGLSASDVPAAGYFFHSSNVIVGPQMKPLFTLSAGEVQKFKIYVSVTNDRGTILSANGKSSFIAGIVTFNSSDMTSASGHIMSCGIEGNCWVSGLIGSLDDDRSAYRLPDSSAAPKPVLPPSVRLSVSASKTWVQPNIALKNMPDSFTYVVSVLDANGADTGVNLCKYENTPGQKNIQCGTFYFNADPMSNLPAGTYKISVKIYPSSDVTAAPIASAVSSRTFTIKRTGSAGAAVIESVGRDLLQSMDGLLRFFR